MKITVLFSLILCCYVPLLGQVTFQKGYFIDNKQHKTECLVRNNDWSQSPQKFKYKLTANGKLKERSVSNTSVFEIYGVSKFIRHQVASSLINSERKLRYNANENGKEEKFLRVLLEGETNLYEYSSGEKVFFYNDKTGSITPLIYEERTVNNDDVVENKGYLSQIAENVRCDDTPIQTLLGVAYTRLDLINYFKTYHKCIGAEYDEFGSNSRKDNFKVSAQFSVHSASIDANRTSDGRELRFGDYVGYRIGFEIESILPLKNRKWSVFINPSYLSYNSTAELASRVSSTVFTSSVEYKSIEVPLGIRYSSYFNEKSKLFVNAMFVFGFSTKSEIVFSPMISNAINATPDFAVGLGYEFNEKLSAEVRIIRPRNLLGEANVWEAQYHNSSLIVGYTFGK